MSDIEYELKIRQMAERISTYRYANVKAFRSGPRHACQLQLARTGKSHRTEDRRQSLTGISIKPVLTTTSTMASRQLFISVNEKQLRS